MSEKSISIIVMRDRGKSFSLRFSPNTFKVFLSVLVIVPILLVGSIWFGLAIYNKYVSVLEESATLKSTIEQNRQTVTRLANLEKFLQKYSPSMLGLLVPSENVDMDNLPIIDGDKDVLMSELAANLAGSPMSFDIMGSSAQEKIVGEKKTSDLEANREELVKDLKATDNNIDTVKKVKPVGTIGKGAEAQKNIVSKAENNKTITSAQSNIEHSIRDSSDLKKIDVGYINIENFSARVMAKKVYITYTLINVGKKVPLQGEQRYYLCSEINGKIVRQELKNPTDDSFRIKKLKHVKSTASIMGLELGKKVQFVMDVLVDGEVVYREFYSLSS